MDTISRARYSITMSLADARSRFERVRASTRVCSSPWPRPWSSRELRKVKIPSTISDARIRMILKKVPSGSTVSIPEKIVPSAPESWRRAAS